MEERDGTVADLIRGRRNERGWSQQELGEKVDVTRNTINRWERGWNGPTSPQRNKLAKALGGKPDEYTWTDDDCAHRDSRMRHEIESRTLIREQRAMVVSPPDGRRHFATERHRGQTADDDFYLDEFLELADDAELTLQLARMALDNELTEAGDASLRAALSAIEALRAAERAR
jgi:transcriptional regulator with XRE-family HTH domain